jgi:putative transposase
MARRVFMPNSRLIPLGWPEADSSIDASSRDRERQPAQKRVGHDAAGEGSSSASDLFRRNFMAERPNALWVADITFLATSAAFLHLEVVLDAWSRRIVGWALSSDLRTRVVLDALDMRWWPGSPTPSSVTRTEALNTRRLLSAIATRRPGFGHPQARSATPATMRCARISSTLECELIDRRRFRSHR